MSVQNWLNETTKAFQEKLKTTDKILPSTWPQLIREKWASGGSGGKRATIKAPSKGWVGTTIPRTGLIENVYVNTELSYEEVVAILEQLTYTELGGNMALHFVIATEENSDMGVSIMKQGDMILLLAMTEGATSELDALIFACNVPEEMASQMGVVNGWNISINNNLPNPIPFNMEAVETHPTMGLPSGAENELLNSLLSITPFVKEMGEEIVLEGEYDGSTLVVDELPKGGWQGTAVPNSGLIENVYFNTALSNEEVISLLQNIEYTEHPLFKFTPIISFNADDTMGDGVCGIGAIYDENSDAYMILQMLEVKPDGASNIIVTTVYSSKENVNIMNVITSTTAGWQEEVISNPVVTLNKEVLNAYNPSEQNVPSGTQNDKLSSLISTTPFVNGGKPGVIDIKSMIENEKKIPLEIEVNAKGNASIITKEWKGTALPVDEYIENVYFNTNLSVQEVEKILENFLAKIGSSYYSVFYNSQGSDGEFYLSIESYTEGGKNIYYINSHENGIFTNQEIDSEAGWNPDIELNPYPLGMYNTLSEEEKILNQELASLVSITPFTQEEKNVMTIEGKYEGISLNSADFKEEIFSGNPVVPDYYVETIYFDTSKSVEDVTKILDSIPDSEYIISDNYKKYFIFTWEYDSDWFKELIIMKNDVDVPGKNLYIIGFDGNTIFTNDEEFSDFAGWNPDFNGELIINATGQSYVSNGSDTVYVGTSNTLLSNLISTNFIKRKNINIEKILNEKMIPLNILINEPKNKLPLGQNNFDCHFFKTFIRNSYCRIDFVKFVEWQTKMDDKGYGQYINWGESGSGSGSSENVIDLLRFVCDPFNQTKAVDLQLVATENRLNLRLFRNDNGTTSITTLAYKNGDKDVLQTLKEDVVSGSITLSNVNLGSGIDLASPCVISRIYNFSYDNIPSHNDNYISFTDSIDWMKIFEYED